jgi:type IV secretory pathway VirB2 component (pilin)
MQGTLTMNRCNLSPSLALIIVILIGLGTTFSYVGYYQTRWI